MSGPVILIGSGPSALALGAALIKRSVAVTIVHADEAPGIFAPTYGGFTDALARHGVPLACTYADSCAVTSTSTLSLGRGYGIVDNVRFAASFLDVMRPHARFVQGRAVAVEMDGAGVQVRLDDGSAVVGHAVVDATGFNSTLVRRRSAAHLAYQVALGVHARASSSAVDDGTFTFMDWRTSDSANDGLPPTFGYGGARPNLGTVFVEETVLATRKPVDPLALRPRLLARAARLGLTVDDDAALEHVVIPMGAGLPWSGQPIAAFGAAASLVHPVTGYQLLAMLGAVDDVADALASAVGRGEHATAVADCVYRALWPDDRRLTRQLFLAGLEAITAMNAKDLSTFFADFLCIDGWRGFVDGDATTSHVAKVMLRAFARAPWAIRTQLMWAASRAWV